MKLSIERTLQYPQHAKLIEWFRLLFFTGSAQVFIQLIGLVSGILIVRLLPTNEYAMYTLANTMLGTMTVLADAGISRGVMAEGGKIWQDRNGLGRVLVTGMALRKRFAVASLLIALPLLWYLLQLHGAQWWLTLIIPLSLIPAFYSSLYSGLLETGPKLHQDISTLQKIQVRASLVRLLLLMVSVFIFPWAFIAILAAGISQIWQNIRLKKKSEKYTNWNEHADKEVQGRLIKMVNRLLPEAMYYCFSGQITIWLLSIFGTTQAIAQMGALGRLASVLNFITVLFGILIVPRFARLPNQSKLLMQRHTQILGVAFLVSVFIVLFVWIFSTQLLWLLGNEYASLNTEMFLITINACLGMFYGVCFSLSTSRGWVLHPLVLILTNLATILIGIQLFNIGSLQGIILFNILISFVQIILMVFFNVKKIAAS